MTTSTSLSGSAMQPKAPAKGSFPLDHLSECKSFAKAYETCLEQHKALTSQCRKEARLYLQCRMERGLMAVEGWEKLGLGDDKLKVGGPGSGESGRDGTAEGRGFVAGARTAKRRKERYAEGKEKKG